MNPTITPILSASATEKRNPATSKELIEECCPGSPASRPQRSSTGSRSSSPAMCAARILAQLAEDGFGPCAVIETSAGNFQAWLKHSTVLPKLVGTFAAQTLAVRYHADPSAADWRRFGRLPGFTNCKPKYRKPDGRFPSVRPKSYSGEQYRIAEAFVDEITKLYRAREQEREAKRASLSPGSGWRIASVSLEQFHTSGKYRDRPAAADIAFCIAAYSNGMPDDRIERALEDDFLAPDASPSRRAAYIRRTMDKARQWIER